MIKIYVFLLSISITLCNCNFPNNTTNIAETQSSIKQNWWEVIKSSKVKVNSGDLITRTGNDIISSSLQSFNEVDKEFSHCGLAFIENGEVFVYHTMGGRENPSEEMLRTPFDSFCNPILKRGFGIFRYDLNDEEQNNLHAISVNLYKHRLKFDRNFDIRSDSTMYCAEYISKALKKSTAGRIIIPVSVRKNFYSALLPKGKLVKKIDYYSIDRLFLNSHCTEIFRKKFY